MSPRTLSLVFACLALAGCGWDAAQESFPDYEAFQGGKFARSEWVPAGLVPRSASDIHVDVDFDFKEVDIEFKARPADFAALSGGFERVPLPTRKQLQETRGFNLRVDAADELSARCGGNQVEFLALARSGQVRYWRSTDHPALLPLACPELH